jgi:hypothetical protein
MPRTYTAVWSDENGADGGEVRGLSIDAARHVAAAQGLVWPLVGVFEERRTVSPTHETHRGGDPTAAVGKGKP